MATDSSNHTYYSQAVILLATAFFLRSAYTLLSLSPSPSSSGGESSSERPGVKTVSESAVSNVSYTATLEDCQATSQDVGAKRKMRAGALLKLIDVAAGVAARRHANSSCVTISVDSVVFLRPIYLGDMIHISASVNRAWGKSMEIGVKVSKTDETSTVPIYVSHSYLTFVAIPSMEAGNYERPKSTFRWIWDYCTDAESIRATEKPTLAQLKPSSRLEARRHLLAGRRRKKRIEDTQRGEARDGVSIQIKQEVRKQVLTLLEARNSQDRDDITVLSSREHSKRRERRLKAVEIEYLIRALAREEEGIAIRDGKVYVEIQGDETFNHPEEEVRSLAKALGISLPGDLDFNPGRRLSTDFFNPAWMGPASRPRASSSLLEGPPATMAADGAVDVRTTLTTTMHLVFPQHTNSQQIIFGGNTMSWSEDIALMACCNIFVRRSGSTTLQRGVWKTVAMDGLEFNMKVAVGELMMLTAVVIKTYSHSCEVYVLAEAEGRDGQRRFTNDALFTLALDRAEGDDTHIISEIRMPPGSALEAFSAASRQRRQQRLELRNMLSRLYG